ncbi:MAG: hypothetical protein ACYC0V_02250 [Armatimonadota bacterium]
MNRITEAAGFRCLQSGEGEAPAEPWYHVPPEVAKSKKAPIAM